MSVSEPVVQSQSPSRSALIHGRRRTRETLTSWHHHPWPAVGRWLAGSASAALLLLAATWGIAGLSGSGGFTVQTIQPPFRVGDWGSVWTILERNLLVLALHAMACVAGFIAGSSVPLQAEQRRGVVRVIHERGGRFAIVFVVAATTFSLSAQAVVLGGETASVAHALHTTPGTLLLVLMPHAVIELTALFLPLAAWIIASRRGEWDQLLAATIVTVAIALPMLLVAALIEVYISPHLLHALL
ncbi:MAG TPA: stage II sporulation protein M [Solirubrobacteraceae bacterium]